MILAPLLRHRRGEHTQVFEDVRKAGFVRVRVDGEVRDLEESITLDRYKWHDIDVVVDRLAIPEPDEDDDRDARRQRTSDSVEQALKLVIPGIVNTFIALFKDTSLVLIIGLFDLLSTVKISLNEPAWTGFGVEAYLFASIVYFVFCYSMSRYSKGLEHPR